MSGSGSTPFDRPAVRGSVPTARGFDTPFGAALFFRTSAFLDSATRCHSERNLVGNSIHIDHNPFPHNDLGIECHSMAP